MNLYPYNNGHLLVIPNEIVDKPEELGEEVLLEIMKVSSQSMKIIREKLNAEGFNFGANIGASAGAGIAEHLHYHIIPRWRGDTNFMPVVGNTKVHVQGLADTYSDLKLYLIIWNFRHELLSNLVAIFLFVRCRWYCIFAWYFSDL